MRCHNVLAWAGIPGCGAERRSISHFATAFCAMEGIVRCDFFQLIQAMVTQTAPHTNAKDSEIAPGRTARNAAGMKTRAIASHATVLV